ncbi:unnamed protein product [Trichogramma brassicae]|uniref:Uncharacterized protein n=1 Tax=Trichogramma brassicae TaxID=86971 RepID=A0A6H5HSX7_9HYME|nr:unnamed protein product [Trichogramma brassicae]
MLFEFSNIKYQPVKINSQDKVGKTALHYALAGRNENLVELLLRRGAATNLADKWGNTPLHYALKCSSKEMVESLLRKRRRFKFGQRGGIDTSALSLAIGTTLKLNWWRPWRYSSESTTKSSRRFRSTPRISRVGHRCN